MRIDPIRMLPILETEDDISELIKVRNVYRRLSGESDCIDLSECIICVRISKRTMILSCSSLINRCAHRVLIPFDIICSGTTFKEEVCFNSFTFAKSALFNTCTFESCVSFKNAKFDSDVTFEISSIEDYADFSNCEFNKDADFSGVIFRGHAYFSESNFRKVGKFESTNFERNVYFDRTIAEQLTFLYVSFCGILSFNSITDLDFISIQSCNIDKRLTIANTNFENIGIKDMETANLIKNEALKSNNIIQFNILKSKELSLYFKELDWKRNFWEKVLILLNTVSNKNGKSWVQGGVFTIIAWLVFFSLYIMSRDGIGTKLIWSDPLYLRQAIDYFWLFNGLNGLSGNSIGWCNIIPFIAGKVFIGYGIYQTISAFRKYGK